MATDLIAFLQNAWSPHYAGKAWPRPSWLRALTRSRSGQRLRYLLDDLAVCENLTPEVGALPTSCLPTNIPYVQNILDTKAHPRTVVVTCGKEAEATLSHVWPGKMVAVPHPAYRLLTNALYQKAREVIRTLDDPWSTYRRAQLSQKKGSVAIRWFLTGLVFVTLTTPVQARCGKVYVCNDFGRCGYQNACDSSTTESPWLPRYTPPAPSPMKPPAGFITRPFGTTKCDYVMIDGRWQSVCQ